MVFLGKFTRQPFFLQMFLEILHRNRIPVEIALCISDFIPFVEIAALEESGDTAWFLEEMEKRRNNPPSCIARLEDHEISTGLLKYYHKYQSSGVYASTYLFEKVIKLGKPDLVKLFDITRILDKTTRFTLWSLLDSINRNCKGDLLDYLLSTSLYQRASIDYLAKYGHLGVIKRITENGGNGRKFAASAQGIVRVT
jgi:hypothetical protein